MYKKAGSITIVPYLILYLFSLELFYLLSDGGTKMSNTCKAQYFCTKRAVITLIQIFHIVFVLPFFFKFETAANPAFEYGQDWTITALTPSSSALCPDSLWHVDVFNEELKPVDVYILGTVFDKANKPVYRARTSIVSIPPRGMRIKSATIKRTFSEWLNPDMKNISPRVDKLPEGQYEIKLEIFSFSTNKELASTRIRHSIVNQEILEAVSPNLPQTADTSLAYPAGQAPVITVTSPAKGIIWYQDGTYQILWTMLPALSLKTQYSNVRIDLIYDCGTPAYPPQIIPIVATTPNDGNYTWSIPLALSLSNATDCYKVRVTADIAKNIFGDSKAFSIQDPVFWLTEPSVSITTLFRGLTYDFVWQATDQIGPNVLLRIYEDNSKKDILKKSVVNTGTYKWKVPLNTPKGQYTAEIGKIGLTPDLKSFKKLWDMTNFAINEYDPTGIWILKYQTWDVDSIGLHFKYAIGPGPTEVDCLNFNLCQYTEAEYTVTDTTITWQFNYSGGGSSYIEYFTGMVTSLHEMEGYSILYSNGKYWSRDNWSAKRVLFKP